jgi:murein DD-endopeptidase MepM/ murein hydrolase activator NlpD
VTSKLIRALLIGLSLIVVLLNWSAISVGAEKLAHKLLFVVHAAALYSKPPDQKLEMPVQGVSKSQVADSWHVPREGDRLHEGQDIFAKRGTPVLSATDGYVIAIGENDLGGRTVSVLGAGGRVYYYAHLDSYAPNLSVGDRVTTETVLGYVGTTGNAAATPPHLHFGVYASGGAVNPLPLLNDRPTPTPTERRDSLRDKKKH